MGVPRVLGSSAGSIVGSDTAPDDIDFGDDVLPTALSAPRAPAVAVSVRGRGLMGRLGPLLPCPGGLRDGATFVLSLEDIRAQMGKRWDVRRERFYGAFEVAVYDLLEPDDALVRVSDDGYLLAFPSCGDVFAETRANTIAHKLKVRLFGVSASAAIKVIPFGKEIDAPQFRFLPIWDVVRKVLSIYACVPVRASSAGTALLGHDCMTSETTEAECAAFDVQILEHLAKIADDFSRSQIPLLLTVSINYRGLGTSRSREILLTAFHRLPEPLRRFIGCELAQVPPDVPIITLTERIGLIKPFFRSVLMEVPTLDERYSRFNYMGLHGVHYNLGRSEAKGPLEMAQVKRAIAEAKKVRLRFGFGGVATCAVADQLAALGAAHLCGPFIAEKITMVGLRQRAAPSA